MYADINGLKMFYEIRGTPDPGQVQDTFAWRKAL
jgi:hypothetical protein